MNGLPYYKAYPRDFFDGTAGMDFEVKAAYRLVLDLIYMHGGRLVDDPRFIAGQMGCSVKKWNGLRSAILATGKISVSQGYLGNLRADKELDSLKSFQTKQRENGSKPKKINGITKATAEPKPNHTEAEAYTTSVVYARDAASSSSQQDQTDREKLLAAMGADPTSGMIGPNGTRLGTMNDMAEARKWADLGLSLDDQCRLIAERMGQQRAKSPHFAPRSFAYFSGAMSDFAARKSSPLSQATKPDDKAAKLARWDRIAKGAA